VTYKSITYTTEGKVGILKLNAPEVLNALSSDMVTVISAAVSEASAPDSGVRCLLMTGEGRAFCAGANLQARGDESELPPSGTVLETHYAPLMIKLRHLPFPFVTAVNGPAVGVGMSFAVMGDMVLAADSAYFLQAFANIGLVPDGGATYYLPRMIGWGRALELSLMADRLPASQALEWGLINRVVPDSDLMDEAMKIASRLADGPKSLGMIRKAYWNSFENSFSEQMQLEANLQIEAGQTWDSAEGRNAFLEKRDSKFEGR